MATRGEISEKKTFFVGGGGPGGHLKFGIHSASAKREKKVDETLKD